MKVTKKIMAGSIESGDTLVTLEPNKDDKLELVLSSKFKKQYGEEILAVATTALAEKNVTAGNVILNDQGSLPGVIRARIFTAVERLGK